MTPADLRSILSSATPGPWGENPTADIYGPCSDANQGESAKWIAEFDRLEDTQAVVAIRNLAPLLLDLWEAHEEEVVPGCSSGSKTEKALNALREAKP